MNKIIRVFPKRTSYTPTDDYVFVGLPPFPEMLPDHTEVHVSCAFTWDKAQCQDLFHQWEAVTDKPVRIGGPAFGSPCDDFTPGLYVKEGIVFTSRGCDHECGHCMVPEREGNLRELPIYQGNIIQDNNFLQTSRDHQIRVFDMLKTQKDIEFRGGLEKNLIDDWFCQQINKLSVKRIYIAFDRPWQRDSLDAAMAILHQYGYKRDKIHCYVLIGYTDDMEQDEESLRYVYNAGAMPFAQLYKTEANEQYSPEWKRFATQWSSPALIRNLMERNIAYRKPVGIA